MAAQKRFLARTGIDANSQTITNLATPVAGTDAANKDYASSASNLTAGTIPAARLPAFTGDATVAAGTSVIAFATTGVTADTYKSVTVDAKGRVTAGSNPTTLAGYGITDAVALSSRGAANGVATLDASGLIPTSQLPSYVDDVLEYANLAAFPVTGETSKIYVAADTNKIYRWSGSVYVWINSSAGSSDTSVKLATARSISATGDASWTVSFDGSADVTAALTLSNSGVAAGTYSNSATQNTPLTIDAKGRVTGTGVAVTITPDWSSITSKPTTLTGYGITDAQPVDADLTAIAALTGTTGLLKKTAANTWSLDTSAYLTANQSITVTGDATGSGATAIALTLANSGVTAGTYNNSATQNTPLVIDAKGRVTGTDAAVTITPAWASITGKPTTLAGYGITDAVKSDGVLPMANADLTTSGFTTSTTAANQVIDSSSASTYRSAKYVVQVSSGTQFQIVEILLIHNGTTVQMTEYGLLCTEAAPIAAFDADISAGSLRLLATPVNAVSTFKVVKTLIDV